MAQVERRATRVIRTMYSTGERRRHSRPSVRLRTQRSRPAALIRSTGHVRYTLFDTALGRCAHRLGRGAASSAVELPGSDDAATRRRIRRARARRGRGRAAAGRRGRDRRASPGCSAGAPDDLVGIVLDIDRRARVQPPRLRRRAHDPAGGDAARTARSRRGSASGAAARPSARRSAATRSRSSSRAIACSPPTARLRGFSAPGGIDTKRRMLEIEGAAAPGAVLARRGGPRRRRARAARRPAQPDEQRAGVVDPGAGPRAARPAHRAVEQRVARAQRGERVAGRLGEPRARDARAARPARARARAGGAARASPRGRAAPAGSVVRIDRDVDADPEHRPAVAAGAPRRGCPPACGRRASTSLGHLTCAPSPARSATARPARSGSSASYSRRSSEQQQRAAGRRGPRRGPGARGRRSARRR